MGMTFQQKFGLRIKELRKRKGLTQEKLAEMISIGVRSLVKIETGIKAIPFFLSIAKNKNAKQGGIVNPNITITFVIPL